MWFLLSLTPAVVFVALSLGRWRAWLPLSDSSAEGPVARKRSTLTLLAALAAGALVAIPVELGVRVLGLRLGVDPKAQVTGAFASMLTTLLLFAPLEEAAKVGVTWPFKSRYLHEGRQGALLGAAVAVGFACVEVALYLKREPSLPGALAISRAGLSAVARSLTGAAWGYALATSVHSRYPDRRFALTWCAVTVLRGLHDHLVFGKGLAALLASIPLLAGMIMIALGVGRGIAPASPSGGASGRLSVFPSLPPPPSFRAMRDALRRAERHVMLHWIVLGTLVTVGVVISCVVGAVVAGRRAGVDFSAVDEGQITGAVPLALVGAAVLLAFLVSGYLVARASGAESVLEPAFAAALAIVAALVLLGLAAPVAVVFALAFAPIAFGLACAGAWVGIGAADSGPLPTRRSRR